MSLPGRLKSGPKHLVSVGAGDIGQGVALPGSLLARRDEALGPLAYLFYKDPVHIVRGEGTWLYDKTGTQYLDCYNNVASIGHCHPKFVDAVGRQVASLNTHTRYLHDTIVEYAEKLTATLPDNLSVASFVCTGTEANDLAVQMARAVTGNHGVLVTESSYHGNSTLVRQLSTMMYPEKDRPNWLGVVEPPNTYRGPYRAGDGDLGEKYSALIQDQIDLLDARGFGTSAFLCDTIFDSNGTLIAPLDYVKRATQKVRDAGGLLIADEVQPGFGRTGAHMWGFENYGVVPDIVTMGKPMGAGIPLAAVITTPEVAEAFAQSSFYFNTYGGNPVSMAAGLSVLNIIEEEGLQDNAHRVGQFLMKELTILRAHHALVGDVRGRGLFFGIELVKDRETKEPAREAAEWVREWLRHHQVLVGTTGRFGNVIKLRPPLVFSEEDASTFVSALDQALSQLRDVRLY